VSDTELLTLRGLERRIKRYLAGTDQNFLAITTPGFEHILASELQQFSQVASSKIINGGVEFTAPFEFIYDANVQLRSANRLLLRIDTFTVRSYPELFNKMKRISWELYCGFSGTFSLSVTSKSSRIHHTGNIENSVAEAITQYMQNLGVKIEYKDNAPIQFFIRLSDDECTISIDTSGELLYKRGYRIQTAHAPIRETLAVSLLLESQWKKYSWIADPFCGSGTFIIEAALMATCCAPGIHRSYAFQSWPSFNEAHFRRSMQNAKSLFVANPEIVLRGSDISAHAVEAASENAKRAGVEHLVSFSVDDCLNLDNTLGSNEHGLLISNLPYGKRADIQDVSMDNFLHRFAQLLKKKFRGAHFTFVSAHPDFQRSIGFPILKAVPFSNGGIPVKAFCGVVK
jgi:putative N6-adenine-specific DNA methylase